MLNQFHQDLSGAPGVKEGHKVATGAGPRLSVDELEACLGQAGQFGPDVLGPVGDVMEAGAVPIQEAGYGRGRGEGLQEFHSTHEGDPDPLGRDLLHGGTAGAGHAFVETNGLLQVGGGHGDVIDG